MPETPVLIAVVLAVLLAVAFVWWWLSRSHSAPSVPTVSRGPRWGRALSRVWGESVDDTTWDRLEEALLGADVGVAATGRVVSAVRSRRPSDVATAEQMVAEALTVEFSDADRGLDLAGDPAVVLIVGVNGSGKTTTIAKLAHRFTSAGQSVRLAAADTFRAAAVDQLQMWGERLGIPVSSGSEGADPASVVHEAISTARAEGTDVVVVDTAGRLHSKRNLMEELSKVHRVATQAGQVSEVLLVLDATAGQNGLAQVREFAGSVPLTGVVLSKLDGTARGGIVVAVENDLGVPVKLVGTGETARDLEDFDPAAFVADLTAR